MNYEDVVLQKIGEAIGICIKDRGYSMNQLARDSSVSKPIIYKILKGEGYEIKSLIRVMRVLQVHLEMSLMSETNNIHTMGGNKPSLN